MNIYVRNLLVKKFGLLRRNLPTPTENMERFIWEKVRVYVLRRNCYFKDAVTDFNTAENITESLVSEGLVTVRREGVRQTPEVTKLTELEDAAKSAGKGKWGSSPSSVSVCLFFSIGFSN